MFIILFDTTYPIYAGVTSSRPENDSNLAYFGPKKPLPVRVPLTVVDKQQAAYAGLTAGFMLALFVPVPIAIGGAIVGNFIYLDKIQKDSTQKIQLKAYKVEQGKLSLASFDDSLIDFGINSRGRRKIR